MVLKKCCWCIELEIGAFIIAWFDFFYSITSTITNITQLSSSEPETQAEEMIFIKTANNTEEALTAITTNPAQDIRATHLAINIFMVIVATGLLFGMIRKNYRYIIGWLIVNAIAVVFLVLAILSSIVLLFQNGASVMLGVTLFLTFEFAIKAYIFGVIYSQFKLIYNENHGTNVVSYKSEQPLQGNANIEYGAINPQAYVPQ